MSRHNDERPTDILAAATAITDHIKRARFDAVQVRFIESAKQPEPLDPDLLAQ